MSFNYRFFSDGIPNKRHFSSLYQAFLKSFSLTEAQTHFTCFAEDESDDPDDWRELLATLQSQEPSLGFTPRVQVTLYHDKFEPEGYDNLLRLVGFLLKSTSGNAAFCYQLDGLMLLRRAGKLTLHEVEASWTPETFAALNQGLAAAEAAESSITGEAVASSVTE